MAEQDSVSLGRSNSQGAQVPLDRCRVTFGPQQINEGLNGLPNQ